MSRTTLRNCEVDEPARFRRYENFKSFPQRFAGISQAGLYLTAQRVRLKEALLYIVWPLKIQTFTYVYSLWSRHTMSDA